MYSFAYNWIDTVGAFYNQLNIGNENVTGALPSEIGELKALEFMFLGKKISCLELDDFILSSMTPV